MTSSQSSIREGDIVQVQDGNLKCLYDATVLSIHPEEGYVEIRYNTCHQVAFVEMERVQPFDVNSGRPKREPKKTKRLEIDVSSYSKKTYDDDSDDDSDDEEECGNGGHETKYQPHKKLDTRKVKHKKNTSPKQSQRKFKKLGKSTRKYETSGNNASDASDDDDSSTNSSKAKIRKKRPTRSIKSPQRLGMDDGRKYDPDSDVDVDAFSGDDDYDNISYYHHEADNDDDIASIGSTSSCKSISSSRMMRKKRKQSTTKSTHNKGSPIREFALHPFRYSKAKSSNKINSSKKKMIGESAVYDSCTDDNVDGDEDQYLQGNAFNDDDVSCEDENVDDNEGKKYIPIKDRKNRKVMTMEKKTKMNSDIVNNVQTNKEIIIKTEQFSKSSFSEDRKKNHTYNMLDDNDISSDDEIITIIVKKSRTNKNCKKSISFNENQDVVIKYEQIDEAEDTSTRSVMSTAKSPSEKNKLDECSNVDGTISLSSQTTQTGHTNSTNHDLPTQKVINNIMHDNSKTPLTHSNKNVSDNIAIITTLLPIDSNDTTINNSLSSSSNIEKAQSFYYDAIPSKVDHSNNFLMKKELWAKTKMSKVIQQLSERQLSRQQYLYDSNGFPRKTFRRMNCLGKSGSIGSLFGGQGTHPSPIVGNPPLFCDDTNPFIKENELFVAGRSDWNPWTPCYAGDAGFVHETVFNAMNTNQKSFHMFIHCSKRNYDGHYYGSNAANKYFYIGRYKRDDECGVEAIDEPFTSFSEETQLTMAEFYRRHGREKGMAISPPSGRKIVISDVGMKIESEDSEQTMTFEHMQEVAAKVHQEEWDNVSKEKQNILVWLEMLARADYHVKVVPVEFIEYDETVYEALVKIDAMNGEINEAELGPV